MTTGAHPDGYRFIQYRANNRHLMARFWNGHDGPAPNTVMLDDLSAAHRYPLELNQDVNTFAPNHKPRVGEMVFIEIEEDRIVEYAASDDCLEVWNALPESEQRWFNHDLLAYRVSTMIALDRDQGLGGPVLVRVNESLAGERGWLDRVGARGTHGDPPVVAISPPSRDGAMV